MINCIGLDPVINASCRCLVLGSMPGIRSLQAQQYYAHPQNRFWPLMTKLLDEPAVPAAYPERLAMLLRHGIALWDSIGQCERQGSLDTAIQKEQPNDFSSLLLSYPAIRTICFNGAKSYQAFRKHHRPLLQQPGLEFLPLPSTSPANARWRLDDLLVEWGRLLSSCR